MVKRCVICGAAFSAPPSSKKITCSAECSARRRTMSHIGKRNTWSVEARARLSKARKDEGYGAAARRGLAAAQEGFKAVGIERSAAIARTAAERLGVPLWKGIR